MPTHRPINHNDMRNMNLAVILNHLHRQAPVSRSQIARHTGLNRATVTNLTRELISHGLVIEADTPTPSSSVGHPSIDLTINPDAGRIIAAEITNSQISTILTDLQHSILWRRDEPVDKNASIEKILDITLNTLKDAYQAALTWNLPILGIGLGWQGMVDFFNDILLYTPNHGWLDIPLGAIIGDQFPVPFYTGNIVHMTAQGENYFGNTQKTENAIFVSFDSAIDGAIFFNETILPGSDGLAGSFGHMSLDPLGEPCTCGNHGCWDLFASQKALIKRIEGQIAVGEPTSLNQSNADLSNRLTIHSVVQAARQSDQVALKALQETAEWIGIGIANLINMMNPSNVVIGGSMVAAEEFLLPIITQEIDKRILRPCENCNVSIAKIRENAGLIGIVATVIWNILNRPEVALPLTSARV
jgi:predicted NBD/HSP70 family sugar kinase